MIRAFILNLLGGTFEVRLIKLSSGKDIPGTCLYKGGYFKCRKAYAKAIQLKTKDPVAIRLQSINLLSVHANQVTLGTMAKGAIYPPAKHTTWVIDEASEVTPEMYNSIDAHPPEGDYPNKERYAIEGKFRPATHDCDAAGPLEYLNDTSGYVPTCSVCGEIP